MMLDAVRARVTGRRGMMLLLALAVLLAAAPASFAQDAASETEIEIVVLPSNDRPGGTDDEIGGGGDGGGSREEGESEVPGRSSVRLLPGTVSVRYVLVRENERTVNEDDIMLIIVVRDDRGSATGWEVDVRYEPGGSPEIMPILVDNRDATIRRVVPEDGRLSDQVNHVRGGRTLGALDPTISLLHATPGSGSGVFFQQLVAVAPPPDSAAEPGTILIQVPFAP